MTDRTGRPHRRPRIDDWYVPCHSISHPEAERCPACGAAGEWVTTYTDGGEILVGVCQTCGWEEVVEE